MAQNFNLSEMIQKNLEIRVKDAVAETKIEAKEILDKKLDQLAVDVALEIQQSQLMQEMAQEIRIVIVK